MKIGDRVYKKSGKFQGAVGTIVGKDEDWWVVDYGDNEEVAYNKYRDGRRWGQDESNLELVPSSVATWEMLRDIKPGEVWKCTTGDSEEAAVGLTKDPIEVFPSLVVTWIGGDCRGRKLLINELTLSHKWIKQEPIVEVDFFEAWAAYQEGKTIVSSSNGTEYLGKENEVRAFSSTQIKGKWVIKHD